MTDGSSETTITSALQPRQPIVCFSHLAWDAGLFQRPQQIMSRLAAAGHPVYYFACVGRRRHVASPMAGPLPGSPNVHVYTVPFAPGVTRLAGIRRWAGGLRIASVLTRHSVHHPVLWFYHPSLFALGYSHADSAIVYDMMDHFPSFESSVDDAYFDELTLLAEADVIFTGGRSLDRHAHNMLEILLTEGGADDDDGSTPAESTSATSGTVVAAPPATHRRSTGKTLAPVHCYPSGVDLNHFSRALQVQQPAAGNAVPSPRFGYFGAIDERIDWDILKSLATATSGTVILAGPVLRDPPPDLPANLHLSGPVEYARLPELLAGFDVCLIPFKNTPLVQFISPTKTPEYLAGGKPVVSTPIPDVVADYTDVVRVASTSEDFVAACLELASAPPPPETLAAEARRRARTWDEIAAEMDSILAATIASRASD